MSAVAARAPTCLLLFVADHSGRPASRYPSMKCCRSPSLRNGCVRPQARAEVVNSRGIARAPFEGKPSWCPARTLPATLFHQVHEILDTVGC